MVKIVGFELCEKKNQLFSKGKITFFDFDKSVTFNTYHTYFTLSLLSVPSFYLF